MIRERNRSRSLKTPSKKRWDAIIENVPKKSILIGAEIGVEQGKTSKVLLDRLPGLFLYLVDRWEVTPEGDSYFNGSRKMAHYTKAEWMNCEKKAMANIGPHRMRTKILKMESKEASKEVKDESLDFIFIDADHSYEGVVRDIEIWMPKLKNGGLAFFHDYENPNTKTGVKQAIHEKLGDNIKLSYDHVAIYRKES